MPTNELPIVRVLLQAVIERAKREDAAVIDISAEVRTLKERLPPAVTMSDRDLGLELARLAAASHIPVRMD